MSYACQKFIMRRRKKERKKTKMAFLADFFLASRILEGTFEGTTVMVYAA